MNDILDPLTLFLLFVIIGLFVRVEVGQRKAARVARETRSEASNAATDARLASRTGEAVLKRLEVFSGASVIQTTRIADAATIVAEDFAAQHEAARAVQGGVPGQAADAAALTRTTGDRPTA